MQMKYFNAVIPGILARLPEPQCENFKNVLSQSNRYYPEAIFSIRGHSTTTWTEFCYFFTISTFAVIEKIASWQ